MSPSHPSTPPTAMVSAKSCPFSRVNTLARRLAAGPRLGHGAVWRVVAAALLVVIASDVAAQRVLAWLPPLPAWQTGLLDAAIVTLAAGPVLWFAARFVVPRFGSAERERLATRLGIILNATVDGIIVTDAAGRILKFNHGAETIFGYREESLLGKSIHVLVPPRLAARHDEHVRAFRDGPEPARVMGTRGVLLGYSQDGREFPVEVSIARSEEQGEVTLVAIVRDVSERHRIEHELQLARTEAEAAVRAKSEFLANMSHEIRTPMNAVIGLTDLLRDTPLNDDQREFVETIHQSGDALLGVINDILDFSKIDAQRLELEQAPFDPRLCVETVADLLAPRVTRKRIDLVHEVDEAVPRLVLGDVTRFRQILTNLAGNAIKFTEAGEVFIHLRSVDGDNGRVTLHVDVRDTGVGLTQEQQEKLFQPFTQGDGSTTRRFGGTGLGLAISRSLVELMGGRISLRSEPGAGATFSFTAPLMRIEPVDAERAAPPVTLAGRRILIVDDNATNRRILIHQVERWGARALPCASPATALAVIAQGERFDLGLLDLHMPGMHGDELARAIQEQLGPATPPLLLLSSPGTPLPPEARQRFAAVLSKPVKSLPLRAAVEGAFGGTAVAAPPARHPDFDPTLAGRQPLRILVADDHPVNRQVTRRLLARFGYQPTMVDNGEEALEIASRMEFDLVLMDMHMPQMDGLEATRLIRVCENGRPIRAFVVAMTANVSREDRQACAAAGMDDFLSKPTRAADLRAVLDRAAARTGRGDPRPEIQPKGSG